MDKYGIYDYFFKNISSSDEYKVLLKRSSPVPVSKIVFTKRKFNFDYGEFGFYMLGNENKEFAISFFDSDYNINDLWKFLEAVVIENEALILPLSHLYVDTVLYTEPLGKNEIRFAVFNTKKLSKKLKEKTALHYSVLDFETDIDIKIKKKKFIKSFYFELSSLFKQYESIAYFEPPFKDFNKWIKDSEIIKDYIG